MRKIDMIVVHCTASRENQELKPLDLVKMHRQRGFYTCGYHYYITRDGEIHTMRPVRDVGAHARGHNGQSIGVAYEGGLDQEGKPADTRTDRQKRSLRILLRVLMTDYPITQVVGHRDLSEDLNGDGIVTPDEWSKMCPCFDAKAEYADLLQMMMERRGL